ncbi:CGNR zinc finger domain-containing protein [Actinacidiphila yeochonensis]|uniref:CGNR zinc finger domain-containing protein n=1 Tax=Actinacidiphila yeochonensis TaxID=89050 RepID=UPI0007C7A749|nr:ABATE domain-containing protein [Actinacidiphila yeochonensis]
MAADASADSGGGEFAFVGGRVCLDFAATLGRRHTDPVEGLPDTAALARWFAAAGLLAPEAGLPRVGSAELARARALREALYRLVRAATEGSSYARADVAALNRAAARPDLVPQLAFAAGAPGVRWQQRDEAVAALATVARDGVLLLGGPDLARVKECGHPACSLLFVDDSQARRRRWCSMERCGNLAKVAGYRARVRQGARAAVPSRPDGPADSAASAVPGARAAAG